MGLSEEVQENTEHMGTPRRLGHRAPLKGDSGSAHSPKLTSSSRHSWPWVAPGMGTVGIQRLSPSLGFP